MILLALSKARSYFEALKFKVLDELNYKFALTLEVLTLQKIKKFGDRELLLKNPVFFLLPPLKVYQIKNT